MCAQVVAVKYSLELVFGMFMLLVRECSSIFSRVRL